MSLLLVLPFRSLRVTHYTAHSQGCARQVAGTRPVRENSPVANPQLHNAQEKRRSLARSLFLSSSVAVPRGFTGAGARVTRAEKSSRRVEETLNPDLVKLLDAHACSTPLFFFNTDNVQPWC